ncbi:hypothetical protein, variant [Aphanomyces invadans]|uniref:Choline transporter-like protein n=1 Tax=Aphanomyces invadans TaxID=157072 RepID=A0A024U2V2_9STRA|nr:hypothetical protein, variant [Aphanomyces invadans]ETV99897.1 hypothetical protein, variant [Aphanomyces invadans]|eukprot:XP_008871673.1 hypothetical protein, variant [Aphanomyces invadans]
MDAYKAMGNEAEADEPFLPGSNHMSFESKDQVPAALFLANVAAVTYLAVAWGVPNLSKFDFTPHKSGHDDGRSQGMSFFLVSLSMGAVSAVLSAAWLQVLQLYASRIISMTVQASAGALLVASIAGFTEAGLAGRAIGVRHRIPFAATNLTVAAKILQRFPQVVLVAYAAIAAQVAWMLLWTVAVVGVWSKVDITPSTSTLNVAVFVMLVSLCWGLQVLRNIVHCTTAGTIGEWWFSPDTHNAVLRSGRRAVTSSFGSICLGSLIVAALSALRLVLLTTKRRKSRTTVNACLECIVGALETHLKAFNKYAYCQVALYGKDFRTAGNDTLQLFREKGWTGVVQESLVSMVLSMGCLVVGAVAGVVGVGYLYVAMACSDVEGASHAPAQCDTFSVMITAFVACGAMGYAMCAVVSSILDSIVATIFVCFAEDPVALHISNSEEYLLIVDAWRQFHPELLTHSTFSTSVSYA